MKLPSGDQTGSMLAFELNVSFGTPENLLDDHIEPFLKHLRAAGYAVRTLRKKRTVARAFARWTRRKRIAGNDLNDAHIALVGAVRREVRAEAGQRHLSIVKRRENDSPAAIPSAIIRWLKFWSFQWFPALRCRVSLTPVAGCGRDCLRASNAVRLPTPTRNCDAGGCRTGGALAGAG